jgi:CheY-like chemotaxis protein
MPVAPRRILVVDDEPDLAEVLVEELRPDGVIRCSSRLMAPTR